MRKSASGLIYWGRGAIPLESPPFFGGSLWFRQGYYLFKYIVLLKKKLET